MIYLNDMPVEPTKFPDGTTQVWKIHPEIFNLSYVNLRWKFESEAEFIHLAQLKELLDTANLKTYLLIDYLPYARQDKDVSNESTFALKTFAKLLNSLKFTHITLFDPHSPVATKLIKNSSATYPTLTLQDVARVTESTLICYPDNGAKTKYEEVYWEVGLPNIYAEKKRDQLTGKIKSIRLHGECKGENVIIVDDICDGGGTFALVADLLIKNGARTVTLFVTHGIFSKGLEVLKKEGINRIFTSEGEMKEVNGKLIARRIK